MTDVVKIIDQDIIFLSYDEPNAEKNYSDLLTKAPWAKRVHGIKGSDSAHKVCAEKSETEYFVTVDADNIVDSKFFNVEINLENLGLDNSYVFSWCGRVYTNNLMYGNGGLKLWTRKFVNNMRTHENSDPSDTKGLVEFCFDNRYYQFNENYSISYTNGNPFQAWRAGFREGVKMCLNQGQKNTKISDLHWKNYERLLIWCNVGKDIEHGTWSMLGAREGCYKTMCTDWNYTFVRDFDWLTEYWNNTHKLTNDNNEYLSWLGSKLKENCNLEITDLDETGSKFFKKVYRNFSRKNLHNIISN